MTAGSFFTDLFGGSVNNEFMKYISNPQIRLIAGMNESGTCYNSNVYSRNEKIMLLRLRKNFWV